MSAQRSTTVGVSLRNREAAGQNHLRKRVAVSRDKEEGEGIKPKNGVRAELSPLPFRFSTFAIDHPLTLVVLTWGAG
jgi:hypothetical protein